MLRDQYKMVLRDRHEMVLRGRCKMVIRDRCEMVPRDRFRWWKVSMCDRAILAPMAPDAARLVPNAARLVQDAAAIGARWCEIARDAARWVRDARSLKAVGEGSRNLHRHTHHTQMEEGGSTHKMHPAQKNCAGLRPRAVPSFILWGRWRPEGAAGDPGGKTTGTQKRRCGEKNLFLILFDTGKSQM